MSKGDELLEKLRRRKLASPMDKRMADAELREKYPAIKEAWERYQVVLKLHK